MTKKVGLTGNIGSGKSLIARIFETLGIPVFYADKEGKNILDSPEVIKKVSQLFGNKIIKGSMIDRQALAGIVFSDTSKLEQLNGIIHPAVRNKFDVWAGEQNAPYVIYEAAILHESGHYQNMDKIIVVTAGEQLRIRRVMNRDDIDEASVRQRMANQWPEEKKIRLADFIIDNNESRLLIPQVLDIHRKLGG